MILIALPPHASRPGLPRMRPLWHNGQASRHHAGPLVMPPHPSELPCPPTATPTPPTPPHPSGARPRLPSAAGRDRRRRHRAQPDHRPRHHRTRRHPHVHPANLRSRAPMEVRHRHPPDVYRLLRVQAAPPHAQLLPRPPGGRHLRPPHHRRHAADDPILPRPGNPAIRAHVLRPEVLPHRRYRRGRRRVPQHLLPHARQLLRA